jgi:hypothetical protein
MDKDDELVRLRIDVKTEILVKPENATREYAALYRKRLTTSRKRKPKYIKEYVCVFGELRSVDMGYGTYEDLERIEDLSERIKMGIDKD